MFDLLSCRSVQLHLQGQLLTSLYQRCQVEWTTARSGMRSITAQERDAWLLIQKTWYASVSWPLRRFWGKRVVARKELLRSETGDPLREVWVDGEDRAIDDCVRFPLEAGGRTTSWQSSRLTLAWHARTDC